MKDSRAQPLEPLKRRGREMVTCMNIHYRLLVVQAILHLIRFPQKPSRAADETVERKVTKWVCGGTSVNLASSAQPYAFCIYFVGL